MCLMQVQKHRQSLTVYLTSPSPVFSSDAWKMIPVCGKPRQVLWNCLLCSIPFNFKDGKSKTNQRMRAINHLVLLKSDLFWKFKMPLPPHHAGHWDWKGEQSKIRAWQEERSDQGDCQDDVFFSRQILNFEFLTPGYFEMMLSVLLLCLFVLFVCSGWPNPLLISGVSSQLWVYPTHTLWRRRSYRCSCHHAGYLS